MRIIAGELKGRRLTAPTGNKIRPTTDKVKEALFSMSAPYLEDGVVIDLFSGTGSLGLEAISRGARLVFFVDKSISSMELTRKNIVQCGVADRCVTIRGDWGKVITRITEPADVIFLDPPYQAGLFENCISKIQDLSLLKEDGIIAAEHGAEQIMPMTIGALTKYKEKKYGTMAITIYKKISEDN